MLHLFQTPRTMAVLPSSNLDMAGYFTRKRGFRGRGSQKIWHRGQGGKGGGESVAQRGSVGVEPADYFANYVGDGGPETLEHCYCEQHNRHDAGFLTHPGGCDDTWLAGLTGLSGQVACAESIRDGGAAASLALGAKVEAGALIAARGATIADAGLDAVGGRLDTELGGCTRRRADVQGLIIAGSGRAARKTING